MLSSSALEVVKGIGPKLSQALVEHYPTWGDIAAEDLRVLTKINGMSIQRAATLQAYAKEHADQVSRTPTAAAEPEPEFIFIRKQIDKFNSRRIKVAVHPGLCKICGFDILKKNDAPEWGLLPETEQIKVRGAMKKHMEFHAKRGVLSGQEQYL
jgi:hypothetical protein